MVSSQLKDIRDFTRSRVFWNQCHNLGKEDGFSILLISYLQNNLPDLILPISQQFVILQIRKRIFSFSSLLQAIQGDAGDSMPLPSQFPQLWKCQSVQ